MHIFKQLTEELEQVPDSQRVEVKKRKIITGKGGKVITPAMMAKGGKGGKSKKKGGKK